MKILILLKWKLGFTLIINLMHNLAWLLLGEANPSAEQICVSGPIFQNIHSEVSKQQRLNWEWQLAEIHIEWEWKQRSLGKTALTAENIDFFLNKHIIQTYFLIKIAQIAISKLPTKWYFAPKFETKVMRDACHPGIPRIVHQGITFNFFNVLNIFAVFLTYFFLWITDDQTLDRRS